MMATATVKRISENGLLTSRPRVVKVSRPRSMTNQSIYPSNIGIQPNSVIHRRIGFSNRTSFTSNCTEPIRISSSIKSSKNRRSCTNVRRLSRTDRRTQSCSGQVMDNDAKDDLGEQSRKSAVNTQGRKDNESVKKDSGTSAITRTTYYQNITYDPTLLDKRSNPPSSGRLSSRMNYPEKPLADSDKNNRRRRNVPTSGCQCSRLCIVLSIFAAILLAAGLAAALVFLLNHPSTTASSTKLMTTKPTTIVSTTTTTSITTVFTTTTTTTISPTTTTTSVFTTTTTSTTTTTTITTTTTTTTVSTTTTTTTATDTTTIEVATTDTPFADTVVTDTASTDTTTITYAPTGIYALQVPTCATWNQTGTTVAGNPNGAAGSDLASLNTTVSIFIDNNFTLYICDRDNNRIMKYPVNATIGIIVAGNGTAGNSATQLNQPKGVAVDQMGAIIVADSSNYRIQRFPLGSMIGTTIAINSSANILGQTRDLHIDVNNAIYVTDSDYSRVVKFYPNNGIGVILAGNGVSGSAANQLSGSYGNFIDGNQSLFIADSGNHRIQMWPAGATSGVTVAGVTGSPGSSLTQLNNPRGVIVDNNGYIYIADTGNNRVVQWTNDYAAGGRCIAGCIGSGGAASAVKLKAPRDIKFDASGNLYVSDQGYNRIQKFAIVYPPNCTATSNG